MTRRISRWSVLLGLAAALVGCGGGGDDEHKDTFIDTKGRLAIAEQNAPGVRILDLDSGQIVAKLTMAHAPSALYTSPGGRYVLAVMRTNDLVQTIDGGIWQEDHGDHLHDYKRAPQMTNFRVEGPQPTHYDDRHGRASIFLDGREGPPLQPSSAVLFDEASIASARLLARLPNLPYAVHGFAEPNGEALVVTHRSADAVDTLPNFLHVWQRSGETFVKSQELPTRCDRMHGSFTRQSVTVAGCADGVAIVKRDASGRFTSQFAAAGRRIGMIAGHPAQPRMIGIGNAGTPLTTHFYDIDTDAGRTTPITVEGWVEGRLRRAHGWNRQGTRFFVLDDRGTLHALEYASGAWRTVKRLDGVIPTMPTAAPFPALAASRAKDEIYLTDPTGRAIVTVNTATLEVASRMSLDFTPSYLTWVGIAR